MPGSTSRLALPYPVPDDNVDVPRDVKALAEKIDGANMPVAVAATAPSSPLAGQQYFNSTTNQVLTWNGSSWRSTDPPSLAGALPGSPYDGQEIYYVADAAAGIVWHLRYRAAASAPYRWEYVGGPPMMARDAAIYEPPTGNVWYDPGPILQNPLPGRYAVFHSAQCATGAGTYAYAWTTRVTVGGTEVSACQVAGPPNTTGIAHVLTDTAPVTITSAGQNVTLGVHVYNLSGGFGRRTLQLAPVAVG